MTKLTAYIEGRAYPQGSKRHVGGGRMIEQAGQNLKTYRQHVATVARLKHRTPLDGPVYIGVTFEFARPKAHYLRSELRDGVSTYAYPCKRGDVDKLLRSTLDALTGVWIHDDAQVVHVSGIVRWAAYDATTITLHTL